MDVHHVKIVDSGGHDRTTGHSGVTDSQLLTNTWQRVGAPQGLREGLQRQGTGIALVITLVVRGGTRGMKWINASFW